ncbi:ABC transporter substrate-binding protein [Paeniglutamicibacter antarcticus]|uniref:ABC transporter substrate-binding protein n=1 Tax=Arthrobacter terrae TaxID=2935737 RepID=A0A931CJ01_9MICC|nr:ABC transporter substrate-binding protein [Arthrobacter terrae]MBG0739203.1 ABC transporter substrate-binding protein [Arthrobacter terrae]
MFKTTVFKTTVALLALSLPLSACTAQPAPAPSSNTPVASATFNFGTGAVPLGLDPALESDSESFRVTRQVLEGLVTVDATTGAPAPSLATSWQELQDGLAYSFKLRPNVSFQDGTPFDAAAVCTNFNRWFTLPPAARGEGNDLTFKQVFKAYSDDAKNSLFKSCTATSTSEVRIDLTGRLTGFLQAMTMPSFAISSPTALSSMSANNLTRTVTGHNISAYGQHPVGTGPFTFVSWEGGTVTLSANRDYWGTKGEIGLLHFITYDQPQARLQALEDGKIDGYDPVTPGNFDALVKSGEQILQRDPFSVMYLGINQAVPVMADLKVRQAIATAIDKETLVKQFFIDGTQATSQFIPPKLSGFNNAVAGYSYDQDKARKLLAESSYRGEEIKFYYPTNVTRTYLPTPEKVYAEIGRELTAVGFNIKPMPVDWADNYLGKVTSPGDHALALMGWNGSYADPDNFVGPLFGTANGEFGSNDPQLISKIDRARSLPDGPDRNAAYQSINTQIVQTVPAVPIAFPISAVALSSRVVSYPVSPVLNEVFNQIKLAQ